MKNKFIEQFEAKQIEGKKVPDFRAGDTLKLAIRIKEGDSESLESISVLRRGRVRRARLFYLRDRRGKAARIKELKK